MESQGQGHTTWNIRSRRATLFRQRRGGRTTEPPSLHIRKDEPLLTHQDLYYRPSLARKKAICDFQVRWPELILQKEKQKKVDLPLIGQSSAGKLAYEASVCSSGLSISIIDLESSPSEPLGSKEGFAVDPQPRSAESPHVIIFNTYLKPELMTRMERRVRKKTMATMRALEQEKEAVKSRRLELMVDIKDMQKEMSWEETESKPFLEYLKQKREESQKKYDSLWRDYRLQCEEIQDRRRELVADFTSRMVNLQKQVMQGRKMETNFRKKLKALRPLAQTKESQDRKIQALEQEKASIVNNIRLTDQEAHLQFLKERAALEKQVEELNLLESGEDITRELKKKAKALEAVAKKAHKDFCHCVSAENRRLQTQLRHLDQEFCELEARREKLEQRKQRWREQQWYLEALARGRQRLQQREHRPPKPQAAPHPTQGHRLGARPRAVPK